MTQRKVTLQSYAFNWFAPIGFLLSAFRVAAVFPLALFFFVGSIAHSFQVAWLAGFVFCIVLFFLAETSQSYTAGAVASNNVLNEYLIRWMELGLLRIDTVDWLKPRFFAFFTLGSPMYSDRGITQNTVEHALAVLVVRNQRNAIFGGAMAYANGHNRNIILINDYSTKPTIHHLFEILHELDHVSDRGSYQLANSQLRTLLAVASISSYAIILFTNSWRSFVGPMDAIIASLAFGWLTIKTVKETPIRREWLADLRALKELRNHQDFPLLIEDLIIVYKENLRRATSDQMSQNTGESKADEINRRLDQLHSVKNDKSYLEQPVPHYITPLGIQYFFFVAVPTTYLGITTSNVSMIIVLLLILCMRSAVHSWRACLEVFRVSRDVEAIIEKIPRNERPFPL